MAAPAAIGSCGRWGLHVIETRALTDLCLCSRCARVQFVYGVLTHSLTNVRIEEIDAFSASLPL